jgi:hypothetical protein
LMKYAKEIKGHANNRLIYVYLNYWDNDFGPARGGKNNSHVGSCADLETDATRLKLFVSCTSVPV